VTSFELQLFADSEQPDPEPEETHTEQPPDDGDGDSNDGKIPLTVDGKEILVTYEEAIALAQQGHRFSQKMAGVNKAKEELDKQQKVVADQFEALKGTRVLADFLAENPEEHDRVLKAFNAKKGATEKPDGEIAKTLKEITDWKAAKEGEEKEAQQLEKELKKTTRAVKNLTGQDLDVAKFSDELTAYYAEHEDDEEELTPLEVWMELHSTEPKKKASQETVDNLRRARETPRAPIGNAGVGRGEPQHATIRDTLRYNALQAGEKLDDE